MIIEFNYLLFQIHVYIFAHCFIMIGLLLLIYVLVLIVKLNQLNEYIDSKAFPLPKLLCFMKLHTQAVLEIIVINGKFSTILFLYLLSSVPSNLVNVGSLILVNVQNRQLLPFFGQLAQQFLHIILFHLICSSLTTKIHQNSKRLIHFKTNYKFKSFHSEWKLMLYIEKFHTKKRYGLSYHNLGLISMHSFLKVSLLL